MRAGTRLAALEMIRSGTTTYADMYYFEEEIARVTKEAGLRAVLGQTIIQFPVPDAKTPAEGLARTERFIKEFRNDDLIVPAVAPHAMYTLDAATLKASRALADRETRAADHPSRRDARRGRDRGARSTRRRPCSTSSRSGFFGPRTLAAHAVHLTPADIATLPAAWRRRLAQSGKQHEAGQRDRAGARRCAPRRCRSASAPTARPATTISTCSRRCARPRSSHKLQSNDPRALPAAEVLAMATREGARALGMDGLIGSLEPGKRADLIVVSMRRREADADVQSALAPGLRHAGRRCTNDDCERTSVDARSQGADAERRRPCSPRRGRWRAEVRGAVGK